jgi:3-oxoacyl-[acyl-carrier-protein] synthase II
MKKRVVITGMGVVTNIGIGVETFWKNLLSGNSGITDLTYAYIDKETFPFDCCKSGEIKSFIPREHFADSEILSSGRSAQMALCSTIETLANARYKINETNRNRIGVSFGTTMGEAQELEKLDDVWFKDFAAKVDQRTCYNAFSHRISQFLAESLGINGPNYMIPNACSAANFAISQAIQIIQNGRTDAMIVGGSDSFTRYVYTGFARLNSVASTLPRPFSEDRDGMMPAEGAGVLLLEEYESAKRRNAQVLAEIYGIGMSCDAVNITSVDPEGLALAYRRALANAGLAPEDISYISPHGTGTPMNDVVEVKALRAVFGDALDNIPLSSIKSIIGHTMGAASAIEAVTSVLTIRDQKIPPTMNLTKLDPEIGNIDVVPNASRNHAVNYVFESSSGFGGNNCVVIFGKASQSEK